MCFGNQVTSTTDTTGSSNNTGSTTANSNTTGSSSSLQNTLGSTVGNTSNATAGSTVGNTSNLTAGQTSATANPAIQSAALGNLDFVNNLQKNGFQGYTGQQVATLAPGQQGTIDAATGIANNGTGATASNLIGGYASAPAQHVGTGTIAQNMSPYMNQYVMQALAPQLQQMDIANAKTNNATNANATGSGAFGDARTGIEQSNNAFNQNVAREGLIGSAYNTAFNTAIGAGAQDVANQNQTQNANAGYQESALSRALGGAGALQNLQTQQLGTQSTANTLNAQDTAQQQAALTAQYNQWLMAQQYPFQTAGLVNSTVGQASSALPATTNTVGSSTGSNLQNTLGTAVGSNTQNTTGSTVGSSNNASNTTASGTNVSQGTTTGTSTKTEPDNSGYALLGGALGIAGKAALSDRRAKADINLVGGLIDGTPVYSYHYKADPMQRKQIGLMAQDVKQRRPDAIVTLDDPDGTMMVDYGKATERSRLLSMVI